MRLHIFLGLLLAGELTLAPIAFAQRVGNGVGNGGQNRDLGDRVDLDRQGTGGVMYNYPPWGVAPEDPKAAQERLEAEKREKEAARAKAIRSHNDPQGGFFGPEDSPKQMFNDR